MTKVKSTSNHHFAWCYFEVSHHKKTISLFIKYHIHHHLLIQVFLTKKKNVLYIIYVFVVASVVAYFLVALDFGLTHDTWDVETNQQA